MEFYIKWTQKIKMGKRKKYKKRKNRLVMTDGGWWMVEKKVLPISLKINKGIPFKLVENLQQKNLHKNSI